MEKVFLEMEKLKKIRRTGWIERGVRSPESVAEHSFLTALMCMILAGEDIDREKAIKMALVHDIVEAEVGDIIAKESWPDGGSMTRKEKVVLERKGLKKLLSCLGKGLTREITELWEEYEEGKTPEAKFVRDIDVAEMIIQAHIYHKEGNFKKPLDVFWDEKNMARIRDKRIKNLVKNIIEGR